MGLMSGITGNAAKLDAQRALEEFGRLPGPGEEIHAAFVLIRDSFIFTSRRLVLVDKQGMTGKKWNTPRFHTITSIASLSRLLGISIWTLN